MLNPILSATPSAPPTYNVGMAETFSWVPVEGANRPLWARASYIVNPEAFTGFTVTLKEIEEDTTEIHDALTACCVQSALDSQHLLSANNLIHSTLSAFSDHVHGSQQTIIQSLTALNDDGDLLFAELSAFSDHVRNSQQTIIGQLSALNDDGDLLFAELSAFSDHVRNSQQTIIIELSALNDKVDLLINASNAQLGQNGFDFIEASMGAVTGNWTTVTVVSTAKFNNIGAANTAFGNMMNYLFPMTFTFSGPISSIDLAQGSIIAYK